MGDHKLKMRMQITTLQKNTNMLETRFFINNTTLYGRYPMGYLPDSEKFPTGLMVF